MILPGHLASAIIASRLPGMHRPTALAASLFPDLFDKMLHWIFHATPSDRLWGHTAWAMVGTTVIAWTLEKGLQKPNVGRSWLWGYAVHLAGDITAPVPLLYPLSRRGVHMGARMREILQGNRRFPWRVLASEGLLAMAAMTLELHAYRQRRSTGRNSHV